MAPPLPLALFLSALPPPNILMIVADDLGFNDVDFQATNRSVGLTPNLRRLADEGVRLGNHHVQPFCSPTRAALMTGRHVLRYGLANTVIWPQDAWALPLNETFLSELLHQRGFYTAAFGKWHLCATPCTRIGVARRGGPLRGGQGFFQGGAPALAPRV